MRSTRKAALLCAPLMALGIAALSAPAANAAGGTPYQATLDPLNNSGASGNVTLQLSGDQATITENVSGLAATFMGKPYPHVQHIHIGASGTCPGPDADKNGDQVVNTAEGMASYGMIGTTLSTKGDVSPKAGTTLTVAPSGGSFNYSRTITLDAPTLASVKAGKAVIVVHGLDPATLSKKAQGEKSELVPSLPLAATSPALCGALTTMPAGGVATGGGSTAGVEDKALLGVGGGLILAAGGALAIGRRRRTQED